MIIFFNSHSISLLSNFEKGEIILTITTSFAYLIKAIHILTILKIEELTQESDETEDVINELGISKIQEM